MKFLVDSQLPVALSRFLESKNLLAHHVVDIQLDEASDREIWEYAKVHNNIIISKDADFFQLANLTEDNAPIVIWVRLGNCRKTALIAAFEKILPDLLEALKTQKVIEIW